MGAATDSGDRFTIEDRDYEHLSAFPAFFVSQSSVAGSTAGEVKVVFNVPREGRDDAVGLMDVHGEELFVFVARRVWE